MPYRGCPEGNFALSLSRRDQDIEETAMGRGEVVAIGGKGGEPEGPVRMAGAKRHQRLGGTLPAELTSSRDAPAKREIACIAVVRTASPPQGDPLSGAVLRA